MGKKTYDILAPEHLPLKTEGATVVITSQKVKPATPTVIFANNDPSEIVRLLESKGYTNSVIIGGAKTLNSFLNANLADEVYFVVEPKLFKTGLPLLQGVDLDYELRLLDIAKLNANTIRVHYEIQK